MRIVLVSETYYPAVNAVTEAVDLELRELRERGHDVWVATADQPSIQHADPNVLEVPAVPLPNGSSYHLTFPALGQVDGILASADLVHAHEPFTLGQWAAEQATTHGVPLLFTYHPEIADAGHHLPLQHHSARTPLSQVLGEFAQRSSAVLIPHPHLGQDLATQGIRVPIHHVPIPLDLDRYRHGQPTFLHDRFGLDTATPVLLTFSTDAELIVDTVMRLEERPHLVIAAAERGLQERIHERSAGQFIHVLEPLVEGHKSDLYADAAAVVLPSDHGGNLRRAMEAAAAGVPVIGPDTVPLRDVVLNQQTGLLVPATSTAFGHAIRQLLYRPALRHRLGAAAHAHAHAQFSPAHSVDRLLDVAALIRRLHRVEA